jgi:hypothetical protein
MGVLDLLGVCFLIVLCRSEVAGMEAGIVLEQFRIRHARPNASLMLSMMVAEDATRDRSDAEVLDVDG